MPSGQTQVLVTILEIVGEGLTRSYLTGFCDIISIITLNSYLKLNKFNPEGHS